MPAAGAAAALATAPVEDAPPEVGLIRSMAVNPNAVTSRKSQKRRLFSM